MILKLESAKRARTPTGNQYHLSQLLVRIPLHMLRVNALAPVESQRVALQALKACMESWELERRHFSPSPLSMTRVGDRLWLLLAGEMFLK